MQIYFKSKDGFVDEPLASANTETKNFKLLEIITTPEQIALDMKRLNRRMKKADLMFCF